MTLNRSDWHVYYDPPPIPIRTCDWHYVHRDYDGGYYDYEGHVCEGDPRSGDCASEAECWAEIEERFGEEP